MADDENMSDEEKKKKKKKDESSLYERLARSGALGTMAKYSGGSKDMNASQSILGKSKKK